MKPRGARELAVWSATYAAYWVSYESALGERGQNVSLTDMATASTLAANRAVQGLRFRRRARRAQGYDE